MRTIAALLVAGLLLPVASMPGSVLAASPAPISISDAIGPGVIANARVLGTASVVVPAGASVTYVAALDRRLAGAPVGIWTRTRTGEWHAASTRTVATDGTVRFVARVQAWIGIQARFAGNADVAAGTAHGRFATVSRDEPTRVTVGCDAFSPTSRVNAGPITEVRDAVAVVGGTLVVTLCSNASTGFRWDLPVFDQAHLRLISRTIAAPPVALPGAAGTETFRFAVVRAGATPVRLTYSQPWAGGIKATWTVALAVHTFSAPRSPVAVTCDQFAGATDTAGHAFVARSVSARIGGDIVVALCSNASTGSAGERRSTTTRHSDWSVSRPRRRARVSWARQAWRPGRSGP